MSRLCRAAVYRGIRAKGRCSCACGFAALICRHGPHGEEKFMGRALPRYKSFFP